MSANGQKVNKYKRCNVWAGGKNQSLSPKAIKGGWNFGVWNHIEGENFKARNDKEGQNFTCRNHREDWNLGDRNHRQGKNFRDQY